MEETVERKYLNGMDTILDIDENSRFINLLAIKTFETLDGTEPYKTKKDV